MQSECSKLTESPVGFGLGSVLGGVVYEAGGYYAAFGMALGLIGLDLIMRLALVEKRRANKWLEGSNSENFQSRESNLTSAESPVGDPPASKQSLKLFAIFKLFRNPRLIIALWGSMVNSMIIGSFDVVSSPFGSFGSLYIAFKLTGYTYDSADFRT